MAHKLVNNELVEMSAEEEKKFEDFRTARHFKIRIENLRQERNKLLAETDYLSLSDQSLTDEMKKYRQDLRDITNGLSTVEEVEAVEFPTKP